MKKSHQILFELIQLRERDYDKFMYKFYEAVTTEFSDLVKKELLKEEEHRITLRSMISYFEDKEEYEKCDVLLHLLNMSKKID